VKSRDKNGHPAVIDACVLINLAIVDRLPILENIPGARFLVLAIRAELITIEQADEIKNELEENSFVMNFDSFHEKVKP